MGSFENKVVIVTGGGRGIGAACAKAFAQAGAHVIITSRTQKELDATAKSINAALPEPRVHTYQADVSDEAQVKALFASAHKQFGYVSVLVNNAAIITIAPFVEIPTETWDALLNINVKGCVYCAREAFHHMMASRKGGSIINISSLAGIKGTEKFPGLSAYVASKFAVVGLTEALAVEGKPHNIRVNCVAPGLVDDTEIKKMVPFLKTTTMPSDIAKAVLWLCDDTQTDRINGTILEIQSNE